MPSSPGDDTEPGRWPQGSEAIEEMIADGILDSGVYANPADIEAMLDDAETHLDSALALRDSDPRAAYSVMYSGARKALNAALLKQGLRIKGGEGGHKHLYEAVKAQLGTTASRIVEPVDRMRRKRNQADYDAGSLIEAADIDEDLPKARVIVSKVRTWSRRLGRF